MATLIWDGTGQRLYETGVEKGVLFLPDANGLYSTGVAWNGLTTVTEAPSGAESNPQYADNIKYLNLLSAEEFGFTIEAFTYPDAFGQCDGTVTYAGGVVIGQQARRSFGFSYKSLLGNDVLGRDFGYKLHLIWNALAAPSEKAFATVNDSPEAIGFSWECTTTASQVGTVNSVAYKPVANITIDSTKVPASYLAALETILYGSAGVDPRLPSPAEVIAMFAGASVNATAVAPTYNSTTKVATIPTTTGVDYRINGAIVTGTVTLTKNTIVTATPKVGYVLAPDTLDRFLVVY